MSPKRRTRVITDINCMHMIWANWNNFSTLPKFHAILKCKWSLLLSELHLLLSCFFIDKKTAHFRQNSRKWFYRSVNPVCMRVRYLNQISSELAWQDVRFFSFSPCDMNARTRFTSTRYEVNSFLLFSSLENNKSASSSLIIVNRQ